MKLFNLRNADLPTLVDALKDADARKRDVVVSAKFLDMRDGNLLAALPVETNDIFGRMRIFSPNPVDGIVPSIALAPTDAADGQLAERLGIPKPYFDRMRTNAVEILDANVYGWLRRDPGARYLVRAFAPSKDDPKDGGILRAFLSDRYRIIDNLDVATAALEAVRDAGVAVRVDGCDLTDKRMYIRVVSPEFAVESKRLLERYRVPGGRRNPDGTSPFGVVGGFVLRNSETGFGRFSIAPRLLVLACSNGLVFEKDAIAEIHLGAKMEEGVVEWSAETRSKHLELVASQTRDAVRTFLSPEYLGKKVEEIEKKSETPLDHPVDAARNACISLNFTEERTDAIVNFFSKSADPTPFGIVQAITFAAHEEKDGDEAYEMEAVAVGVLSNVEKLDRPTPSATKKQVRAILN